jgi:hypothetical protein
MYVNIPEVDARQEMKKIGMENWLIDAIMEFYNIIKAGHASQTTTVVEQITGRKPISFAQFAKDMLNLSSKSSVVKSLLSYLNTSHLLDAISEYVFFFQPIKFV